MVQQNFFYLITILCVGDSFGTTLNYTRRYRRYTVHITMKTFFTSFVLTRLTSFTMYNNISFRLRFSFLFFNTPWTISCTFPQRRLLLPPQFDSAVTLTHTIHFLSAVRFRKIFLKNTQIYSLGWVFCLFQFNRIIETLCFGKKAVSPGILVLESLAAGSLDRLPTPLERDLAEA